MQAKLGTHINDLETGNRDKRANQRGGKLATGGGNKMALSQTVNLSDVTYKRGEGTGNLSHFQRGKHDQIISHQPEHRLHDAFKQNFKQNNHYKFEENIKQNDLLISEVTKSDLTRSFPNHSNHSFSKTTVPYSSSNKQNHHLLLSKIEGLEENLANMSLESDKKRRNFKKSVKSIREKLKAKRTQMDQKIGIRRLIEKAEVLNLYSTRLENINEERKEQEMKFAKRKREKSKCLKREDLSQLKNRKIQNSDIIKIESSKRIKHNNTNKDQNEGQAGLQKKSNQKQNPKNKNFKPGPRGNYRPKLNSKETSKNNSNHNKTLQNPKPQKHKNKNKIPARNVRKPNKSKIKQADIKIVKKSISKKLGNLRKRLESIFMDGAQNVQRIESSVDSHLNIMIKAANKPSNSNINPKNRHSKSKKTNKKQTRNHNKKRNNNANNLKNRNHFGAFQRNRQNFNETNNEKDSRARKLIVKMGKMVEDHECQLEIDFDFKLKGIRNSYLRMLNSVLKQEASQRAHVHSEIRKYIVATDKKVNAIRETRR